MVEAGLIPGATATGNSLCWRETSLCIILVPQYRDKGPSPPEGIATSGVKPIFPTWGKSWELRFPFRDEGAVLMVGLVFKNIAVFPTCFNVNIF